MRDESGKERRAAGLTPALEAKRRGFHVSHSLGLGIILFAYFVITIQYAVRTPAWQAPDEPAHYNYVRYVVETGALPVLRPGDYDQKFIEQFTDPKNTPNLPIEPLRYQSWQPPLYYLLAAPVFALTGGSLLALRLFSVALGGALIVAAFLVVREIYPHTSALALGTAAFVAFVPQHVAMMAAVNNDSLAELLLALTLLQMFRVLKGDSAQNAGAESPGGNAQQSQPAKASTPKQGRRLVALGVLLGLSFLTKGTNYLAVPVVFAALLFSGDVSRPPSKRSGEGFALHASRFTLIFVPALALGAVWWIRNLSVYGGFDILGLANHNAVVVGQPLTSDWIARMGLGPFLTSALTTTFHSFWGQFGWMGVPMPDNIYLALGVLSLVALAGWLWSLRTGRTERDTGGRPTIALLDYRTIAFVVLVLLTFGYYIFYNFTFVQHQGRYLFPALIPLGWVFSIGIDRWSRWLPRPLGLAVYIGVFAALAALDVWALYRFIIPSLAP